MDKLNKLQDIITDHDETQEILSNKIGVNRNQIRRWIHGESEMGIWKLKKICEHYKISADYILGLEKGLDWPREEKRKYTANCTKCTFLHRNFWETKNRPYGLFFIVTATSYGDLPKNVIETRYAYC